MPELPEVETVVRDLRPYLVGRTITGISMSRKRLRVRWQRSWNPKVIGQSINQICRRGKWIQIRFNSGGLLVLHLGMTGQLTIQDPKLPRQDHTHLIFQLGERENELRFRDIRRFGSVGWYESESWWADKEARELGPEPFDLDLTQFHQKLVGSSRCLKALLLDQSVLAGVGNIYADESLFAAGLLPQMLGKDLRYHRAVKLAESIRMVLEKAIAFRGSSIRNYVGGSGLQGGFQNEFCVYGRTDQPCVNCAGPIRRVRLAGRSTHYCPRCQKGT